MPAENLAPAHDSAGRKRLSEDAKSANGREAIGMKQKAKSGK